MNTIPPPRSTTRTLLWFAALAVVWQLAPVRESWKVLPPPEDTFLVKGWSDQDAQPGPLAANLAPPPLPAGEDDEDDEPAAPPPAAPSTPTGYPVFNVVQPVGAQTAPASPVDPAAAATAPSANAETATADRSGRRPVSPLIAPLPEPQPIEEGCLEPRPDGSCAQSALEPFFRALARTAHRVPGAVTRITHFGDSIIASDYISATVRRRLQKAYGDSGHGFLLAARPWRWYDHRGVVHDASDDWLAHGAVFNRFRDRLFGFGGVSFQTTSAAATAEFATAERGSMGRAVSRFDLYYQEQPAGGAIDLLVDGVARERLLTRAESVRSAFHALEVPDGASRLTLRTVGDGPVRLYGVTLERDRPGIVYDSVGMVGGSMAVLRKNDPSHWAEQLRHRRPDLVVLSFGANESLTYAAAGPKAMRDYQRIQAATIRQIRAALPEASILVMGPLDAAEQNGDELATRPSIPKINAAQRRAALESGAAFWDAFEVMGGEGSMAKWVHSRIGSTDMVHPSWGGAVFIGNELYRSLRTEFERYVAGPTGPAVANARTLSGPGPTVDPSAARSSGSSPLPSARPAQANPSGVNPPPATNPAQATRPAGSSPLPPADSAPATRTPGSSPLPSAVPGTTRTVARGAQAPVQSGRP